MNEKEKKFKQSYIDKIKKYDIPTTFNECLKHAKNIFVEDTKVNGRKELIDVGMERYLYEISPYYFICCTCTITLPGTGTMYAEDTLYYFQREILKDFTKWQRIVVNKTRQCGMSTLTSLIFFWDVVMFNREWETIISKDSKASQDVLLKIKENMKNIPAWLNTKMVVNNTKGVKLSNESRIDSLARSKSSSRGSSSTQVLCDEFAFYQTDEIAKSIISSVMPSLAKTQGRLFIVSTPNGSAENSEGYQYFRIVSDLKRSGGTDSTSRLYDISWWEVPDEPNAKVKKGYNDKLQEYIDRDYFHHPEVKAEAERFFAPIAEHPKENEWLSFQYTTSGEVKYRQEILKDFVVLGNTVFNADIIKQVQQRVRPPKIEGDLCDRYYKGLWTWELPKPGARYIMGIDVAKGTANDNSVIEVLDMDTKVQVAEYLGKCSTHELALLADKLGHYYNNARIYVECNSIGEAVFNELFYNCAYENMFSTKKVNKMEHNKVWTGWMTSTKTRELITNNLIDYYYKDDLWADYHPYSQRLLDQMKQWVWVGGRPDHSGTAHDDAILAMAILLYNIPAAKQNYREENEVSFIAEDGREISAGNLKEDNIPEGMDYDVYDEEKKEIGEKMGIPEYCEDDPLDIYKWLIS